MENKKIKLSLNDYSDDVDMPVELELELKPEARKILKEFQERIKADDSIRSIKVNPDNIFVDTPTEYEDGIGRVGTEYVEVYRHGFYYKALCRYDSAIFAEYEFSAEE